MDETDDPCERCGWLCQRLQPSETNGSYVTDPDIRKPSPNQ